MRLLVIMGGLTGFAIGMVPAWIKHGEIAATLWRASVGALVAGLLMRWWGSVLLQNLQQSVVQRQAQSAAKSQVHPPATTNKSKP
jgi:hypothetical protein